MDPIACTYLPSTKQNLCWVNFGANVYAGGLPFTFFPLIQQWDTNCNKCDPNGHDDKKCNDVDLMYLLFFDEQDWSSHSYIKSAGYYGAQDFTWFKSGSQNDDSKVLWSRGGGNTGVLVINNYGGVKFLNELKYPIPRRLHCAADVIALAQEKGDVKAAILANLETPPTKLQEFYYECHYSSEQCVSQGIAAGSGYANLVHTVLMVAFGFIAGAIFGIPLG